MNIGVKTTTARLERERERQRERERERKTDEGAKLEKMAYLSKERGPRCLCHTVTGCAVHYFFTTTS